MYCVVQKSDELTDKVFFDLNTDTAHLFWFQSLYSLNQTITLIRRNLMKEILYNESGQGLTGYALIISLVALVAIAVITFLEGQCQG